MTDFYQAPAGTSPQAVTLTPRERETLALIAEGCTNGEIARRLFIAVDTVKTNNQRMFRKLGARNREHAVALAFRAGVLR